MSHDQRPAPVRAVTVDADPARRSNDAAQPAIDKAHAAKAAGGRMAGMLDMILFVAGAAGSGIATILLTRG